MDEGTGDEQAQIAAFVQALTEVAARMGGITVISASVACQATFGPLEKMTPFQQRSVNGILARYHLHLDFPDIASSSNPAQPIEESDDEKATRFIDMLAAVASPETGAGLERADAEAALGEVYGDPGSLSEEQRATVRRAVDPYGFDFEFSVLRNRPAKTD
jgi:hypothetical protein